MPDLSKIKHIVVLMLENRSFDNVFGYLRPADEDFDGLDRIDPARNYGEDDNTGIAPWPTKPGIDSSKMPSPDPGEKFEDIHQQIHGGAPAVPLMGGFILNYVCNGGQPADIMHCFTPAELPALSQLANCFAVSDRWFASAPCQTWPNRFFVHTGTANGYTHNALEGFPFQMQTIFNELDGVVPWKIYFHDFPQTALLSRLWPHFSNFRLADEFFKDAAAGQLPGYSFIEPMYFPEAALPNDMHPPHNVQLADALVAKVYNAVRASPNWASTLLVIVFDEHGGCYDHVGPPAAVRPDAQPSQNFNFDAFGVRVPAVVISPYTAPGKALRPDGATPFDHTSIIRTVRNCFGIPGPLSAREAAAPDLSVALNAEFDINRGPASIEIPASETDGAVLAAALAQPVNRMQDLLQLVAKNLEPLARNTSVEQHLKNMMDPKTQNAMISQISDSGVKPTAGNAGADVRKVMQDIMARFAASAGANTGVTTTTIYRGH